MNPAKKESYENRLYTDGLKKMKEVERKHQEAMIMKELNETKDLKFYPQINPISNYFG